MNSIDVVGIRLVKEKEFLCEKSIRTPLDAVEVLANELKFLDREILMTLNMNSKNKIINAHVCSIGSANMGIVDAKSVFKSALLSGANRVMIIHNHPSGDCTPSQEDIDVTNLLIKGGRILEIEVLDHIVIGENEYYSIVGDRQEKYTEINNTDNLQNSYESLELCENNDKKIWLEEDVAEMII